MSDKIENKIEFSVGNIFNLLLTKKYRILIFVFIFTSLVIGYSYIAPQEYKAQASILPPEDSQSLGGFGSFLQSLSGGLSLGSGAQPSKLMIFQEILKSREVAKKVAELTNLDKKYEFVKDSNFEGLYKMIAAMLVVEMKKSGLITVTTITATPYFPNKKDKDETAKLSADIVNSSIKALDILNREKSTSKAKRKKEFIERILAEKKILLNSLDSTIEKFRQENKIIALDDQSQAILNNATSIGSELAKAEVELNLKLLEYEPQSQIIKSSKEKVSTLNAQYQKIQKGGLAKDYFSIPLENVPTIMRRYSNLIRDQKIMEQLNLYLETQRYQEAIQEHSDVSTVETLDWAQIPKDRYSPSRKVMFLLGVFLSLLLASGYFIGKAIYKGNIIIKKIEA